MSQANQRLGVTVTKWIHRPRNIWIRESFNFLLYGAGIGLELATGNGRTC